MSKGNKKKAEQLGMSHGAASNRLRKQIMFALIKFSKIDDLDICFQCGEKIENVDNLSIEHIVPWLDSEDPVELYFDLDNIAFSHLKCNVGAARVTNRSPHGTEGRYNRYACRCDKCREANTVAQRKTRNKRI